jgi:hypothetical protein
MDCRSLQREMEDKAKKERAALASGLEGLKKVQAAPMNGIKRSGKESQTSSATHEVPL